MRPIVILCSTPQAAESSWWLERLREAEIAHEVKFVAPGITGMDVKGVWLDDLDYEAVMRELARNIVDESVEIVVKKVVAEFVRTLPLKRQNERAWDTKKRKGHSS